MLALRTGYNSHGACARAVFARFRPRLAGPASGCATCPNTGHRVCASTSRPLVFPTPARWRGLMRCDLVASTDRGIVASSMECRLRPRPCECSQRKGTRYQRERHRYPTESLPALRNRITSHPFRSNFSPLRRPEPMRATGVTDAKVSCVCSLNRDVGTTRHNETRKTVAFPLVSDAR